MHLSTLKINKQIFKQNNQYYITKKVKNLQDYAAEFLIISSGNLNKYFKSIVEIITRILEITYIQYLREILRNQHTPVLRDF